MTKARLIAMAAALTAFEGGVASAFECPAHIATAETEIDRVSFAIRDMADMLPVSALAQTKTLLDEARVLLAKAQAGHEAAAQPYDHALSIAYANSALAYATAADKLHLQVMDPH